MISELSRNSPMTIEQQSRINVAVTVSLKYPWAVGQLFFVLTMFYAPDLEPAGTVK